MAVKLLNNFLLGADPELVFLNPPDLVNGMLSIPKSTVDWGSRYWGFDHGGYVLEPHPRPNYSARMVCRAIKASLDTVSYIFPDYRQRAGAFVKAPQRALTLGGHVHLDLPSLSQNQVSAMNLFTTSLEDLDILPLKESTARRAGSAYGALGDIRAERGRVEYRSMCSWLFSRKAAMLSITGIKLCAVAPTTVTKMRSIKELTNWLERFKGRDDDVDWILDRDYFGKSMTADPEANIPAIWKADPEKGKERWGTDQLFPGAAHRSLQQIVMRTEELRNQVLGFGRSNAVPTPAV